MRTRNQAFDLAGKALDLAQNLNWQAEVEDPKNLRLPYKLSRKKLMELLVEKHAIFETATREAYELYNDITDWASEYPLEGETG